jgi:hypothetical protein
VVESLEFLCDEPATLRDRVPIHHGILGGTRLHKVNGGSCGWPGARGQMANRGTFQKETSRLAGCRIVLGPYLAIYNYRVISIC